MQMESGWLPLAGPGTREMRFGVEGSWIEKDPPSKLPGNGETMAFVCDEGTFGGDPKMDALKRCDMRLSPPDDTPLQLSIQAGGKCMARVGETVSTAPCSSARARGDSAECAVESAPDPVPVHPVHPGQLKANHHETFFTHGVARSMHVAPSAWLAVVLSVMAGSASAQLLGGGGGGDALTPPPAPFPWYLPHSDLTPYQFVSDDGRCLQTDYELNHGRSKPVDSCCLQRRHVGAEVLCARLLSPEPGRHRFRAPDGWCARA